MRLLLHMPLLIASFSTLTKALNHYKRLKLRKQRVALSVWGFCILMPKVA
jgi:hypothetical protein